MKFYFYFVLFLYFISSTNAYTQATTKIDSLQKVFEKHQKKDTTSVLIMIEMAQSLKDKDNRQSLQWAMRADSLSQKIQYQKGEMKSKSSMAWSYYQLGNYDLCFDFSLKALKIAELLDDNTEKVVILNSLGAAYFSQENYQTGIENFTKAYQIAEKNQLYTQAGRSLNNIAFLLYKKNDFDKAEKIANQALEYNLKHKENAFASVALRTLGDIAMQKQNYNKAENYYQKSYTICKEIKSNILIINVMIRIGKVNKINKKYNKAIQYLLETEKLSSQYSYRDELLESYQHLSSSFKENKQIENAYSYLEKYNVLYDSIYNDKNAKRMQLLSSQFESEKKQAQIELLNKEKIIQEESIQIQKIVNYGLIVGLLLVLGGAVYVFYNYKEKQKMNTILTTQKAELTQKNEEVEVQAEELTQTNNAILAANEEINKKNISITASINYAQKIQSAFLPSKSTLNELLGEQNHFLLYKPKDILSGDFYWVSNVAKDGSFCVVLADCTGHGVPGALMSIIGCELLHQIINMTEIYSPEQILNQLSVELTKVLHQNEVQNQDGIDLVILRINKNNKKVYFSGAMNSLYYIQPQIKTELVEIKGDKIMIGGRNKKIKKSYQLNEIDISTKTTFYLTTDGFKDQFGGYNNKKYTPKKLREKLQIICNQPLDDQKEILKNDLETWQEQGSEKQTDDITLFGFVV